MNCSLNSNRFGIGKNLRGAGEKPQNTRRTTARAETGLISRIL